MRRAQRRWRGGLVRKPAWPAGRWRTRLLKAIIMDLDGTLIDTNYLHAEAWARAFRVLGLEVPRAAIHRQIGKGSDKMLPVFVQDEAAAERADKLHSEQYAALQEH